MSDDFKKRMVLHERAGMGETKAETKAETIAHMAANRLASGMATSGMATPMATVASPRGAKATEDAGGGGEGVVEDSGRQIRKEPNDEYSVPTTP